MLNIILTSMAKFIPVKNLVLVVLTANKIVIITVNDPNAVTKKLKDDDQLDEATIHSSHMTKFYTKDKSWNAREPTIVVNLFKSVYQTVNLNPQSQLI